MICQAFENERGGQRLFAIDSPVGMGSGKVPDSLDKTFAYWSVVEVPVKYHILPTNTLDYTRRRVVLNAGMFFTSKTTKYQALCQKTCSMHREANKPLRNEL